MNKNKMPKDFLGLLFYVLGLTLGTLFKIARFLITTIVSAVYGFVKRDSFKRQIRLAVLQTRSDDANRKLLGRENIRNLICQIGFTDGKWHQRTKFRKNVLSSIECIAKEMTDAGDVSESEEWKQVVTEYFFANFDKKLLEPKERKAQRRNYRVSRRSKLAGRNSKQTAAADKLTIQSTNAAAVANRDAETAYRKKQEEDFERSISQIRMDAWANDE